MTIIITYKEILNLKYNLAPSQLNVLDIPNKNLVLVKDLLDRKLKFSDNGREVGSVNYVSKSNYYFIRTKALQRDYFLPCLDRETTVAIRPQVFKSFNLKESDIIISKNANIGEVAILDRDYPNYTMSGALYRLPITKNELYFFAFLKHSYFREQLYLLVPKGSTIRNAKTMFLDCKVPFPNQRNAADIIKYIELLTQVVIDKEKEIKKKNQLIFELIEKELLENQQENEFRYINLKFSEILSNSRIDSGYYCYDYKEKQFRISNYKYGAVAINKWKFEIKRGQNLQVSQIGKSIYSDQPKENFYILARPTNFSEFGTIEKLEYLGSPKKLSLIEAGDVVFSAEGTIGKSIFINDSERNWITNIHGIILSNKDNNIKESIFLSCFVRFLRKQGLLDYISVGGQGGSLAKKYWKDILIPKFPELKQQEISLLYHNPINYSNNLNLENFLQSDQKWNQQAGILELDKSIKKIKEHLNKSLNKIVNDEKVEINFDF